VVQVACLGQLPCENRSKGVTGCLGRALATRLARRAALCSGATMRSKWLELCADYRCNNRCLGCYSVSDRGPSMSTPEALEALAYGRRQGADALWLGGGDPTLRKDLFALVSAARRLGFARIKLETNGMLLAYPDYARRVVEAGVTEVAFAIKGARAETHDRYTATPGCHALMLEGISHMRAAGLGLEGDVLVYRGNAGELPEIVQSYHARGVERFRVWLLSALDSSDAELRAEVPKMSDVIPHLRAALALRLSEAHDFIVSLHTPPCTLAPDLSRCRFFAAELGLVVANPGGHRFRLEQSPIEGGHYLERCATCRERARCNGLRRDYLALHGDSEIQPL
jgi:MoaA/NifB/PqqE/SkfB family radical SAM enzyme